MSKRIGIVVGEASGDLLGAGLVQALQKHFPDAQFEGIGGPRMLALGFKSFFPQDRLAVMGLIEPLKRLPELLGIRKSLKEHFVKNPPDIFIGIDAPDFNLNLERYLRKHGIKTVHYVSPSVWAWRRKRIHKIARAVDRMLTLFPFEQGIYEEHGVPVTFVGHPLADELPVEPTPQKEALRDLGLSQDQPAPIFALLPGSRASEIQRLGSVFLEAAQRLLCIYPNAVFLIPSANEKRHDQLKQLVSALPGSLPVHLIRGQSHRVMAAADVVVMASGTTTLEAMLLKKPMVIAYKMAPLGFWLLKKMVKIKNIGLPNLLAGKTLVPEWIQNDATPQNIVDSVKTFMDEQHKQAVVAAFYELHQQLRKNASETSARAVVDLIEAR